MEMNRGDFYRTHIDRDKFPLLKKFVASKMANVCLRTIFFETRFYETPHRSVLTDEQLENGLRVASTSIKVNLEGRKISGWQNKPASILSLKQL